ncbi:FxsA family protein [Mycobacterium sp. SMC-4]|uniref:FxsA family protein n=1 Tax=Mycobacterium sp. SMC-4 TaxID=2857059 RepID=UPI0021B4B8AD|nr:FxsA family protein [Mycobacterium sp. SMC-4]UXA16136.1 membrane protein FxsA [Mycobacterium sp. SMC-4]
MAMRLFLLYAVVELAVLVALASTIGFGWTVLLFAGTFVIGLALAGSQLRRHVRRLRSGLTLSQAQGAVTDSVLVALGTVLVVIPGLASSVLGALLLLPPTRAAARPLVTALAARRAPLIVGVSTMGSAAAGRPGRGDYIDGEVVDVDSEVITVDGEVVDVDRDAPPPGRADQPRLPE